jgi:ubiquinol-cytochrome c reductase cytochrome c subunit
MSRRRTMREGKTDVQRRGRVLRWLGPSLVVSGVAAAGLLGSGALAGASTTGHLAARSGGDPNGTGAQILPISYTLPPDSYIAPGKVLFEANCASCHGADAYGSDRAPNLVGVGAATVDFWVSTGRMPLASSAIQAVRKPPRFTRTETLQIAAYVASLAPVSPNAPSIPSVNTSVAGQADGLDLFVLDCAACHTVTGAGDALADGYFAPSLHIASRTQVAEAIRTGPGNMPRFGPGELSDKQVADIVSYVTGVIQQPDNRGGLGIGGIGPVAEGFVALLIGVGGLMLLAFWLGERA